VDPKELKATELQIITAARDYQKSHQPLMRELEKENPNKNRLALLKQKNIAALTELRSLVDETINEFKFNNQ
jgi:hypothetical protein